MNYSGNLETLAGYTEEEQRSSVGWRLTQLFSLPVATVPLAVTDATGNAMTVPVRMRLLSDSEMQAVYALADNYGIVGRPIVSRREILSRAILSVDGQVPQMPISLVESLRAQGGEPTELDHKRWVFGNMMPIMLDVLMEEYDKLLAKQSALVSDVKKKLETLPDASPPLMNSLLESSQPLDTSLKSEPTVSQS